MKNNDLNSSTRNIPRASVSSYQKPSSMMSMMSVLDKMKEKQMLR